MPNNTTDIMNNEAGWAYLAVVGVLFLACIVCNGLILAVFLLDHAIRNQTNIFVVSLACADIVVGVVSMPLWIANSAPHITTTYYLYSIDLLCCSASIFSCALLSLERALKIICPYWYANTATTDRVKIVILFGWIAAILVGGLSLARGEDANNIPYISFITLVIYVLPVLAICISYLSIFFVARKHSNDIRKQSRGVARDLSPRLKGDTKTAWRLGIFIAVFIICWTPVFVTIWVDALLRNPALMPLPFRVLTSTLPYLNAVINPFLYALGNSAFRKSMKKLYKRKTMSRNAKSSSSSRRIDTSTLNTNINNSPTLSRTTQTSPKTARKDDVLLPLYQQPYPSSLTKLLSLPQSKVASKPLINNQPRRDRLRQLWESSV